MTDSSDEDLFQSIRDLTGKDPLLPGREEDIWKRFGKKCAIMVLDTSGFTVNTRETGIINYLSCIIRLRDIISPVLLRHGCTSMRFHSDDVFAEFPGADDALAAARDVHRTVSSSGIEVRSGCGLGVCAGIGYGDVLCSLSEGVFGDQMNMASKLGEDLAEENEILLTQEAYQAISKESQGGFTRRRASMSGVEFSYYLTRVDGKPGSSGYAL
ncbi:MAG: hypothetical protein R6U39_01200 [Candidatus Aegiribacteria sp.]